MQPKSLEEELKTAHIPDPYHRALLNIMYTGGWLRHSVQALLRPYDLTEPQFNVLRILRGARGAAMTVVDIRCRMVHRDSNVSRIVDKLEEKGLVSRTRQEANRRAVDVAITDAGGDMLMRIQPDLDTHHALSSSALTAVEAEHLNLLLDKLRG